MTDKPKPPGPGSTVAARLLWARKYLREFSSDRAAAVAFGFPVSTYRKHESGERGSDGLKESVIKRYAKAFRVNPAWLQTGQGSHERTATVDELSDEERRMIEVHRALKQA